MIEESRQQSYTTQLLEGIDRKLQTANFEKHKYSMARIKSDISEIKADIDGIKNDLAEIKQLLRRG